MEIKDEKRVNGNELGLRMIDLGGRKRAGERENRGWNELSPDRRHRELLR